MNPETGKRLDDRLKMKSYIGMKKIFAIVALLMVSVTLTARQKPADQEKQQPQEQEQAMVQRLYETQRFRLLRSSRGIHGLSGAASGLG